MTLADLLLWGAEHHDVWTRPAAGIVGVLLVGLLAYVREAAG